MARSSAVFSFTGTVIKCFGGWPGALLLVSLGWPAVLAQAQPAPAKPAPFQLLYETPNSGAGGYPVQFFEMRPGEFYGLATFANNEVGSSIFSLTSSGTYKTIHQFPPFYQAYSLARRADGTLLGDGGLTQGAARDYGYFAVYKDKFQQFLVVGAVTPGTIVGATGEQDFFGFVNPAYQVFSLVRVDEQGKVTTVHRFAAGEGIPYRGESVVKSRDGSYYGVAAGSPAGLTKVWFYRITASGTYAKLADLPDIRETSRPITILESADDGFYLTVPLGGRNKTGTILRVGRDGTMRTLAEFPKGDDLAHPAFLMQASDGQIYGSNSGLPSVLFRLEPGSGRLTALYHFDEDGLEGECICRFVQGSDGKFYGAAFMGGRNGTGTLFRLDAGLSAPK